MQTVNASLEEAIDAICEILLGPDFADRLRAEHERHRGSVPLRLPEFVYPDEVASPEGYPCCELVAVRDLDVKASSVADLSHQVSCQWSVTGDDPLTMGREVKRLIAATRGYFRGDDRKGLLLPIVGGRVTTGDADYGPVVHREPGGPAGKWIKSASIDMEWRTFLRYED